MTIKATPLAQLKSHFPWLADPTPVNECVLPSPRLGIVFPRQGFDREIVLRCLDAYRVETRQPELCFLREGLGQPYWLDRYCDERHLFSGVFPYQESAQLSLEAMLYYVTHLVVLTHQRDCLVNALVNGVFHTPKHVRVHVR